MRCAGFTLMGLILLLAASAGAQPRAGRPGTGPATAPSRVTAVTVYQGTALVTREVEVPAGQGLMELIVTPLPPLTVDSSLYTEGNDGLRVLATRYRMRAVKDDTRAEVRTLQEQIRKLQAELQKLHKDREVAQQNMRFTARLEDFTASTMKTLAEKGLLNAESTLLLAKHVVSTRGELAAKEVELQQQIQASQEAAEFAQRQLDEVSSGASRTERDAVIVLDKAHNAAGRVQLNYIVSAATWQPRYKLRAGGEKDPVQLEYLAAIEQQSGEDWTGADVTLSTAQPMLNAAPPELLAMEISVSRTGRGGVAVNPTLGADNYIQSYHLRQRAAQDFNTNNSYSGNTLINQAGALAQTDELLNPGTIALNSGKQQTLVLNNGTLQVAGGNTYTGQTGINAGHFNVGGQVGGQQAANMPAQPNANDNADQQQQIALPQQQLQEVNPNGGIVIIRDGPSVTYHLKNKLTIPSRNDEQLVEVARVEFTADYFYKAIPILASAVYRQATMTNKSEYVLLPGEATMYVGKDFVGRMTLPLVAIGEEFVAGFGIDPQVQVARQLVSTSRGVQGANQTRVYDYRIRISSYKPAPIKLQLWDRLPKADAEAVGVNLVRFSPELTADPQYVREDRPDNLLRWDLTIEPGMTGEKAKEVTYQFKLEYARDVQIGNFKPAAGKAR